MLHWRDELGAYHFNYYGNSNDGTWDNLRQKWCAIALEEAGYTEISELPEIQQPVQVLLTGLLIMADWISSNTDYFPLIPIDSCGDPSMYPARVDAAWSKLALPEAWSPQSYVMDRDGFLERFSQNKKES